MNEIWAYAPEDSKAHLYCDDGAKSIRRLCHRKRIDVKLLKPAGNTERCRICLNIRGLIVTRRHRRKKTMGGI